MGSLPLLRNFAFFTRKIGIFAKNPLKNPEFFKNIGIYLFVCSNPST